MVTRDVFQLELEKRGVVQAETDPVTGGIELSAGSQKLALNLNRNRRQFSWKPFGHLTLANSVGVTRHTSQAVPATWDAWKVRVYNASAFTVPNSLVAVAASKNVAVPYTPTEAWTTALFGGVAAHTVPAGTIPDGTNFLAGMIESDVMFAPSVVRDDGASGSILMLRQYIPNVGGVTNSISRIDVPSTFPDVPDFGTHGFNSYFQSVDGVTSPTSFNAGAGVSGSFPFIEFVGFTRDQILRVHVVGSSTFEGYGEATGSTNPAGWAGRGVAAFNQSGQGYAATLSNNSQASATTASTIKKAIADIGREGIDVCVYAAFSTNDADRTTVAGQDRCIGQVMYFIDECRRHSVIPILSTFQAKTGDTGATHTSRQAVNSRVRALATSLGLLVLDFDLLLSDQGSTGAWLNAANTSDGLHPNSAGHAVVGAEFSRLLKMIAR